MVRRSLLLAFACVALAAADTGFYSTVQVTETDGAPKCQAGQIKFGAGQVACSGQTATVTITGGSGGGPSGQINSAAQYSVPYYSVSGSSNVLSGATGFRTDNSTITIDIPVTASSATVRQLIVGNVEGNADGLRFFQGSSNETLEYYASGAATPNSKLIISNSSVGANARGFSFTTASGSRIFRVDPSIAAVFVTGNLTASSATTLSGTVTVSSGALVTGPGGIVNTYGITTATLTANTITATDSTSTIANVTFSTAILSEPLYANRSTGVVIASSLNLQPGAGQTLCPLNIWGSAGTLMTANNVSGEWDYNSVARYNCVGCTDATPSNGGKHGITFNNTSSTAGNFATIDIKNAAGGDSAEMVMVNVTTAGVFGGPIQRQGRILFYTGTAADGLDAERLRVDEFGNTTVTGNIIDSGLTASMPVQTNASKQLVSALISVSTGVTGTLAAAQFPALTGDVTTSAGALATTAAASQSNIKTFTSSITVTSPLGFLTTYGITGGSLTINGPGAGEIDLTEGTAPSGVSSKEVLWADSTAHSLKFIPNNGSSFLVAATSATPTSGNLVKWMGASYAIGDAGTITGDVSAPVNSLVTTAAAQQNNIATFGASSITVTGASGLYVPNGIIQSTAIYVSSASIYQSAYLNGNTSTAQTIDWSHSNIQLSTATGNVTYTFLAPSAPRAARLSLCVLTGAGSFTATWPATVKWPGGVAPVLTTTASKIDCFTFTYIYELNGGTYLGEFGQNF